MDHLSCRVTYAASTELRLWITNGIIGSALRTQLRPGDRVVIQYEAEVVAAHCDGREVSGFEMVMIGAPPGET